MTKIGFSLKARLQDARFGKGSEVEITSYLRVAKLNFSFERGAGKCSVSANAGSDKVSIAFEGSLMAGWRLESKVSNYLRVAEVAAFAEGYTLKMCGADDA